MGSSPIPITPDIVIKLQTVVFELSNFQELSTGIHPFIFGYMSQVQAIDAKGEAAQYVILQSGQGAPPLKEATALATPSKLRLPLSIMQTAITLKNFASLFGEDHKLTTAYKSFWNMWLSKEHSLLELSQEQSPAFPAMIVRWVQNRISLWIKQQMCTNAPVSAPKFHKLFAKI